MADVNIRVTAEGANEVANIFKGLGQSIEGMGGTLKRVFETAAGVQLATSFQQLAVQAAAFAKELVTLGLEAQRQNDAFERMTKSLGVNSAALATALETASKGIVDISDVATTAVRGLQEGLDTEQLRRLMEVATTQAQVMGTTVAQAFNTLTTAIINHNEKALKTAGIIIDNTAAYEKYAASQGKSADQLTDLGKSHAIYLAVLEKTAPAVAAMSQEQLTNSQATEKAASAWKNFKDQLGIGIVETLGSIVIGIKQATAAANEWSAQASTKYVEFGNTLAGLRDKAVAWGASMVGITPALATTSTATVKLGEAAMEASRGASASARGLADMGTNAAAAGPHFRTTAGELAKMAREAEQAAEAIRKADEALIKAGDEGWVRYAEAVIAATEAEQMAEVAITDRARAQEAAMMEKDIAGWVAYAEAVFAATEQEQMAEVAITDRARAQADAALKAAASAKMMSEGFRSLTLSAEDAALEMAILTDSTDAFLQLAEDARWDEFGKGIEDMFLSVTDTFTKMADGLIAGTLDIGDAFKNLGQNLLTNFVQIVIHQVFDPILKEAASFVTSLIRMGASAFDGFFSGASGGGGVNPNIPGSGAVGMGPWNTGGGGAGGSSILGLANLGFGGISGASSFASAFPAINSAIVGFNAAQAAGEGFFSSLTGGAQSFAANLSVGTMGTAIAGLGTLLTLYTNISALMSGQTAAGIGGLSGMAVGAIGGGLAGSFLFPGVGTLAGGLIGAGIGGALGNLLGGLFGGEDWDAIHAARATQRTRTGLAALGQTSERIFSATDLASLGAVLDQSMAGIASKTGDVLLRMLTATKEGGIPMYLGTGPTDLTLSGDVVGPVVDFLKEAGFTGADFSQGRVNSIGELIAATGKENWEDLIKAFNAVIQVFDRVQENFKAMADISTGDLENLADDAVAFFETMKIAGELGEAGFENAERTIKERLAGIAATVVGGIERLRDAAAAAIMLDPVKLVRILDLESFKREGEEVADVAARMAASLQNLGTLMRTMQTEIDAIKGTGPGLVEGIRLAQAEIDIRLQEIMAESAKITDPSDIFPLAKEAYDLVKTRYEMEIKAAQQLVAIINSVADQLASTAGTLASNAGWLAEAGIGISRFGVELASFASFLPTVEGKMTALGGAIKVLSASLGTGELNASSIANALTPILQGFVDTFIHVMNIADPGARLAGLTGLLDQIGQLLSVLPEDQRKALIAAFGPEVKILVEAIEKAAKEQALAAKDAADQLQQLMKDSGALNVENFIVMTIDKMADALQLIVINAGQALEDAVTRALDKFLPRAQFGVDYVPTTRPYVLHEGERVLTKAENVAYAQGAASHGGGGGGTTVTLSFGAIHLARGGRQEAEEFIATVEASIKHGRLRDAVQRAAVGQA